MSQRFDALLASAAHLRDVAGTLDDQALVRSAYPAEWKVADVLSHLGSGAVITLRRFEDTLAGRPTPDDFSQGVWDEWNAKSPRAQADDALAADRRLLQRIEESSPAEQEGFQGRMGPMTLDFEAFLGMRLNEHVFHTWDVEVTFDPEVGLLSEVVPQVVDNLEMIARFTAKPTGSEQVLTVRTSAPERAFTVSLRTDGVEVAPVDPAGIGSGGALDLPAEAYARLVYGRLDDAHTPPVEDPSGALTELRRVFPGF